MRDRSDPRRPGLIVYFLRNLMRGGDPAPPCPPPDDSAADHARYVAGPLARYIAQRAPGHSSTLDDPPVADSLDDPHAKYINGPLAQYIKY